MTDSPETDAERALALVPLGKFDDEVRLGYTASNDHDIVVLIPLHLRKAIAQALASTRTQADAAGYRRGQEEMRDRCAKEAEGTEWLRPVVEQRQGLFVGDDGKHIANFVRTLPITGAPNE